MVRIPSSGMVVIIVEPLYMDKVHTLGSPFVHHLCVVNPNDLRVDVGMHVWFLFSCSMKKHEVVVCRGVKNILMSECIISCIINSECLVLVHVVLVEAETTELFVVEFWVFTATKYPSQEVLFELGHEKIFIVTV